MPTTRQFEEAAIEFCLNTSAQGVWAMRLDQVDPTTCDVTVRLGTHYRGEVGSLAIIRVMYDPDLHVFSSMPLPGEALLPDSIPPEAIPEDVPTDLLA